MVSQNEDINIKDIPQSWKPKPLPFLSKDLGITWWKIVLHLVVGMLIIGLLSCQNRIFNWLNLEINTIIWVKHLEMALLGEAYVFFVVG